MEPKALLSSPPSAEPTRASTSSPSASTPPSNAASPTAAPSTSTPNSPTTTNPSSSSPNEPGPRQSIVFTNPSSSPILPRPIHHQKRFKSWSALYSTALLDHETENKTTRLTPVGSVDYSPAVSLSGKFVAVASYGSRPWGGEFHQLNTDIVVFRASQPEKRVVVCERGGWPSFSGNSVIYFHHQDDDGCWSIFRIDFNSQDFESSTYPMTPTRVTPSGLHCFTPAAMHDGKRIAVATRRCESKFRHVEIFDVDTETFSPVTSTLNPDFHHYNPFVSPDSEFPGYHRFRGETTQWGGESIIPYLEPVSSPVIHL